MNETSEALSPTGFESETRHPGLSNLRSRVRQHMSDFAPAAQRVCQVLASLSAEELLYLTAAELGRQTRTSNATVVRTLQALGYEGLADLKASIASSTLGSGASNRARNRVATTGGDLDTVWEKVTEEAVQRIEQLRSSYASADFVRAVELLLDARIVLTHGFGTNAIVAENLARQLRRIGLSSRQLVGSGFQLADEMLSLERGATLVLLVPRKLPPELDVMLEQAYAIGAKTILVTHASDAPYNETVTVVLHAPNTDTGITSQPLSPLIVADALVQGVAAIDAERTVQTLHTFGMVRRRLGY
jgi:DNA-binding MurR/RpiR family transcriptional regulator